VNTDDLNDAVTAPDPIGDFNTCICPDTNRPYKAKDAVWSLQKAMKHTFDQALDKSMTLNIWSCGLDLVLQTWNTSQDKNVRTSLISYAINDIFAPTNLYFHLSTLTNFSMTSTSSSQLNTIIPSPTSIIPSFVIISDSHCKTFTSPITTSNYRMITKAIPGLQWTNQYENKYCAYSLIRSKSIVSLLSSSIGILLLIGTNSVRTTSALEIIEQVEDIINTIRLHHGHLSNKHSITIVSTFPCYKVSRRFPSDTLLKSNIDLYNDQLKRLSERMKFSCLDLEIHDEHLHYDQMHLTSSKFLYDKLIKYFDKLIVQRSTTPQSQRRSRSAITRRNRKRHEHVRMKQKHYTLIRPIHPIWKLQDVKQLLKHHQIKYARLPEIYKHQIRIQFHDEFHKEHAEQILSSTTFDEQGAIQWNKQHQ
jgi:hypothetical protein